MKITVYGFALVGFALLVAGVFRVAEANQKCAGTTCSSNGALEFPTANQHCGFDTTLKPWKCAKRVDRIASGAAVDCGTPGGLGTCAAKEFLFAEYKIKCG